MNAMSNAKNSPQLETHLSTQYVSQPQLSARGPTLLASTTASSTDDLFADPVALYASLHSANAPTLSKAERRRLRILLRARRCRRQRGNAHVSKDKGVPVGTMSSPRCAGVTSSSCSGGIVRGSQSGSNGQSSAAAAASIKDKKAARVIRNREVALRARQMAKLKMKNLESENCSLKSRASSLESENLTLRSYVQRLTGGRGAPLSVALMQGERMQQTQWPHDSVSLDNGVVGGVPR